QVAIRSALPQDLGQAKGVFVNLLVVGRGRAGVAVAHVGAGGQVDVVFAEPGQAVVAVKLAHRGRVPFETNHARGGMHGRKAVDARAVRRRDDEVRPEARGDIAAAAITEEGVL